MICKITALCWLDTDNYRPDRYCFYTEVELSNKDILKIGNFVIEKSNNNNEPSYIFLILNREFLSSLEDLEEDIDIINYDKLSVLYEHNEYVQYYEDYYLIERENGKFGKYFNIDEVLRAIKFFKYVDGNQFTYIGNNSVIEDVGWGYISLFCFLEGTILVSVESTPPRLVIHNCATSYSDLVQATERVSWNECNKKKNGGKSMFDNLTKNFKFGKMDTNAIKYSFNGIAFQTEDNDYVVYNPDMTFTNVSEMVMDIPIYVMPVPKSDIKIGDIIIHNSEFVIVQSIESKEIRVARPRTKEIVGIIPEKSIFGFDFYTKVIDFTKNFSNNANTSNPFGNLPMLMMMDSKDSNNDMLMFMMMNGGAMDFNNPMFMYMMMSKSDDKSNLLPLMMLMNQNKNGESMTGYKINNSESKIVLNTEGLNWYPVD